MFQKDTNFGMPDIWFDFINQLWNSFRAALNDLAKVLSSKKQASGQAIDFVIISRVFQNIFNIKNINIIAGSTYVQYLKHGDI